VQSFADLITAWRMEGGKGRIWIAVETLYSMDGDTAPLSDLATLAARHEAMLILDEAHGTGVFGPGGRGLSAGLDGLHNVVTLHTCGKAMGVEGALICGPQIIIDYLINRARAFIFSTAPSPLMAVAVSAALDRIEQADDLRARLKTLRVDAAESICAPLRLPQPRSQIIPVLLGEDRRAMAAAAALQEAGFDIRGIRPPTVPPGTSRLRISLTLNVGRADVAALGQQLQRMLA
jgi:8-amino-7-oxononanoate synthase